MANGPPPAPIGTVGVGYAAVNGGIDETLVVDELCDVATDDLDVMVALLAEVVDAFVLVVLVFVVDTIRFGIPFGAGAPLTTRR